MIKKFIICFLLVFYSISVFSQINEDKLKASVLFYIAGYINWPSGTSQTNFNIGIFGKNISIKEELTLISQRKKINGKLIVIQDLESIQDLQKFDLLFVCKTQNNQVESIFQSAITKGILVVTDEMQNNLFTMINFKKNKENNEIGFEINKQNIILAKLDYQSDLLLYGGTELDIKELYRATQKLLETEKTNVALLKNENQQIQLEINEKNNQISKLEKNITKANLILFTLNDTIKLQKQNISQSNIQLALQQMQYQSMHEKFKKLTFTFTHLNDSIGQQTHRLNNLDNIIKERESTIQNQSATIGEKDILLKAEQKNVLLMRLFSVTLFLLGLLIFWAYRQKRKYNNILEIKVEERTQELKTSNEQLANSERNYREIFNATTEAILIHNVSDGSLIDVNNSMLSLYGYTKDQLQSVSLRNLSAGTISYTEKDALVYFKTALEKGNASFEWYARKNNGDCFWVDVVLKKANIGGQERVIAVVRDIDEKKKIAIELENYRNNLELIVKERTEELAAANEELTATNEELYFQREQLQTTLNALNSAQNQLIHSEKMASLGILSAGIAHEINNPLNFINGGILGLETYFMEHLEEHFSPVAPLIHAIHEGVKRASDIVSSLSHYSRQENLPRTNCNIHSIIDRCLVMLQNQLKHKIEIQKKYVESNYLLVANESQLHQAILNILANSIQAIEEKGIICIETEISDEELIIKITDSGIGISQENLEKIFDPFFTTKDPGKGTGLGLSITYKIIKDHQGFLKYISKLGEGTKVILTLPIKKSEPNE